jgi:Holliday junction resolvase RusA-like endonuclease
VEASKKLPAWRKRVTEAALEAVAETGWETLTGPVAFRVLFVMPRPKTVPANKRALPIVPPDIDKLVRAVADSCTNAGVWSDDSHICKLEAYKIYDDKMDAGAVMWVSAVDEFGVSIPDIADVMI